MSLEPMIVDHGDYWEIMFPNPNWGLMFVPKSMVVEDDHDEFLDALIAKMKKEPDYGEW